MVGLTRNIVKLLKGVVKMTAYELLEILKDHYKDDKTLIEEANDLLEQIHSDNKFVYKLEDELEEYTTAKGMCPLCGNKLVVLDTEDEDRGEYMGTNAYEKVDIVGCENTWCSYIIE